MKHVFILALIAVLTFPAEASKPSDRIIEFEGDHRIIGDSLAINTLLESRRIVYTLSEKKKIILKDSFPIRNGWFIYPESKDLVWVFNGNEDLTLIEFKDLGGRRFTSVSHKINPKVTLVSIPPLVRDRLPKVAPFF